MPAASRSAGGKPNAIQLRKDSSVPARVTNPAAMALGGVPTSVPMPPRFAATAMPSGSAGRKGCPGPSVRSTGAMTATIIAAVAVFDMNIDSTKVMPIAAISTAVARDPAARNTRPARVRSSPVRAAASARMKPARNSQISGLASGAMKICQRSESSAGTNTSSERPRSRIDRPMTRKATAKAGIASVAQRPAASTRMKRQRRAAGSRPAHSGRKATPAATARQPSTRSKAPASSNSTAATNRRAARRVSLTP